VRVLFLGGNTKGISNWLEAQGEEVLYTEEKVDIQLVKGYNPDIIVSYNYRHILKKDILGIPEKGAINLHISYLPWNRGTHPNIWSFIEDTPKGVTIHYIDEGVDTGDILLQKEVLIEEENETLKTSYDMLHKVIQELFKSNWEKLRIGAIKSTPQPREGSLHYKKDSRAFEAVIKETGWNMPIKRFKKRLKSLKYS
jgi:methionyl-tRNA formyltransferase